jgi:RNA polymerase sigma factor (sigma-70 family)
MTKISSDENLLRRLQSDPSAFDAIYIKYKGPAVLLAKKLLGSSFEVAEDLVQDVFTRWWANSALLELSKKTNVNLSAFILQSVRFSCVSYFRTEKSKTFREAKYFESEPQIAEIVHNISDTDMEVRKFMDDLRPIPKDMLTLYYLQEYGIKEIANEYGLSPQKVRKQIHKGLTMLRKRLRVI